MVAPTVVAIQLSERAGSWRVSLRLGHAHVLTVHRTVIHCVRAAPLPDRSRQQKRDEWSAPTVRECTNE